MDPPSCRLSDIVHRVALDAIKECFVAWLPLFNLHSRAHASNWFIIINFCNNPDRVYTNIPMDQTVLAKAHDC
jgi:hypothetical protein